MLQANCSQGTRREQHSKINVIYKRRFNGPLQLISIWCKLSKEWVCRLINLKRNSIPCLFHAFILTKNVRTYTPLISCSKISIIKVMKFYEAKLLKKTRHEYTDMAHYQNSNIATKRPLYSLTEDSGHRRRWESIVLSYCSTAEHNSPNKNKSLEK